MTKKRQKPAKASQQTGVEMESTRTSGQKEVVLETVDLKEGRLEQDGPESRGEEEAKEEGEAKGIDEHVEEVREESDETVPEEDTGQQNILMRDHSSQKVDREVPKAHDGKKRRRYAAWIWWVTAACALAVLGVGGLAMAKLWEGNELETEVVEQPAPEEGKEDSDPAPEEPETKDEPEEKPEPPKEPDNGDNAVVIEPRPAVKVDPEVTPGHKVVALTFDDGPSAATTPRLLDILKERGVKATFFVLGTMARQSPEILRREAAEGHEVASHTPYHTQQTLLNAAQVRAEAAEMDRIFREILGTVPPFTRPPYGSLNQMVQDAMGQPLIIWSVDPRDWQYRNAATVCTNVLQGTFDGSVILVHDIHASTVDAVPCIIDRLRAQGYEFLTVSELAKYRGVELVNGGVYGRF